MKDWSIFSLVIIGIVVALMAYLLWFMPIAPADDPSRQDYLVAICRDGSRIYTRPDGTHYARLGNRPVRNPETVCK